MGETQPQKPSSSASNALHERPNGLRRARPPDIELVPNESRVPLRAERSMKRDSKIGLRSIFTRSKAGKAEKDVEEPSRAGLRPAGIRASLADFGNWPYRLHSSRSEASLISTASVDSRPTTGLSSPYQSSQGSSSTDKRQSVEPSNRQVVSGTWTPPPLFQVYPQAVKHATLPACNVSVEALARNTEARGSKLIQATKIKMPEHVNDFNMKAKGDTLKKKPRGSSLRNSLEWTSKIFVLVTSGYLLQYAAEGTYNRVPEKILQLTATSAAYASDLIPGRHWVLQVASATDADGNSFTNTKSHRPKLSMRDTRHVSNLLLIFETPESMDNWLAVLRREIALHGGKKKMSETGNLEADDPAPGTEARPTQRQNVMKDRDRFSYVVTRDFSYPEENDSADFTENDGFPTSPPRRASTYTIDNASSTASMISSDGQRLDNLRNSSSSHRFSYVSSAMVTSAGSSPACSPIRASFSSQREELQPLPSMPEVRLRPNAAAIVNRRQSMQALISTFETPIEQTPRSYTNPPSGLSHEIEQLSAPSVPNFSVPHAVGKRFSLNASMPNSLSQLPQTLDHEKSSKPTRKTPPTALLMSRPLSIVIDQPSPRSPCSPNSMSMSVDSCQSNPFESEYATSVFYGSPEQGIFNPARLRRPSQPGSISQVNSHGSSQSISSYGVDISTGLDDVRTFENMPRAASSLDSYGSRRRLSGIPANRDPSLKRSSVMSGRRSPQTSFYSSSDVDEWEPFPTGKASPVAKSSCSPKRSAPSLRSNLSVDLQEKLITSRKSMPQLNEGPPLAPPAPPPNYALPPIPRKPSRRTS